MLRRGGERGEIPCTQLSASMDVSLREGVVDRDGGKGQVQRLVSAWCHHRSQVRKPANEAAGDGHNLREGNVYSWRHVQKRLASMRMW